MKSSAEAWADVHEPGPAQCRSRYKPLCACCAPEAPVVQAARPQRLASARPVLAWRARMAALQARDTYAQHVDLEPISAFEAVDIAGEATKMIVNEVSAC